MAKKEQRRYNQRPQRKNPSHTSSPQERTLYDKQKIHTWQKTAVLALAAGEFDTPQTRHVLTFCFRGFLEASTRVVLQGCPFWFHEPHAV
jgi:hypothetical protein